MKVRVFDAGRSGDVTSGYGVMSKQITDNLKKRNQEVVYFPDDKSGEDVVLWIRPPHYIEYPQFNPTKKNVFYTMHESETFEGWKSNWPSLLNKCTAVVTPTEWNKRLFIKNGVKVPIYVIPLGVDSKTFHGHHTYEFSILSIFSGLGSDSSRENWKETIKAYYNSFYGEMSKSVTLTLKSYKTNMVNYKNYIHSLWVGRESNLIPSINVMELDLTSEDLNELYSKHWLFVKNANREGWSLPVLEALASGIKVAHTTIPVFDYLLDANTIKFENEEDLENIFLDEFRLWKKKKGYINQFSWKQTTEKLLNILLTI